MAWLDRRDCRGALVVAEIVVLFAGVSSRYLFQKPIIWTDELAGILFLWLAMLGAVLAFQRAEHMRMTAVVGMLRPRARAFLDVLAIAAPLAFLVLVLHPAYESRPTKFRHDPRSIFRMCGGRPPCRSASG